MNVAGVNAYGGVDVWKFFRYGDVGEGVLQICGEGDELGDSIFFCSGYDLREFFFGEFVRGEMTVGVGDVQGVGDG